MTNMTDTAGPATDGFSAGEHMESDDFSAYLAGSGDGDQARAVERHALVCRQCRHALVEAAALRKKQVRRRLMRRATPFATAAVLVVAATTVVLRSGGPPDPVLRGDQGTDRFGAVAPVGAAVVGADAVVFTWRAPETDAHYALTVTDANGDVLWSAEPVDTSAALPSEITLESGEYYYWFVDAFLEGANSTTTGVQEFRVR
jgi:hypothetical protein